MSLHKAAIALLFCGLALPLAAQQGRQAGAPKTLPLFGYDEESATEIPVPPKAQADVDQIYRLYYKRCETTAGIHFRFGWSLVVCMSGRDCQIDSAVLTGLDRLLRRRSPT